ncbi:MAG TPA: prolyl oligopeptidase family serine peptidase [Acidobacteriota bacterium]|nr:prolyl oligopeptidase family serine peptidase [Acidobacteriota bacterium]
MKRLAIVVALVLCMGWIQAEDLTIDQIMEGEDFVGVSPSDVRWQGDSRALFFSWREPGGEDEGLYRAACDEGMPVRLSEDEEDSAWPRRGEWDEPRSRFLSEVEGDIVLLYPDGSRTTLIETRGRESRPRFSRDGNSVYFERDDNLFSLSLEEGGIRQITDFRQGDGPKEKESKGNRKFLEEQQEKLFEEFSGERKEEREKREAERQERDARAFFIGRRANLAALSLSPDERYVVFRWSRSDNDSQRTEVPEFVTEDGFTGQLNARSKVGEPQGESKVGIYTVEDGQIRWLEELKDMAFVVGPEWNDSGDKAAVWALSSDFKERWIYVIEPETGQLTMADHLRDEAWIGGPAFNSFGWVPGAEDELWFISERDGWSHLYRVGWQGEGLRQLTSGAWEVHGVELSPDKQWFLLNSSKEDLGQRHLYRLSLDGGELVRLTEGVGRFDATVSPDGSRLAVVFSSSNQPPELFCGPSDPGAELRRLTDSTLAGFESYDWREPEIVSIPARDGAQVTGRFYKPETAAAGNPAVIFVHGAGYLQNAHRWWSSYYREYMFHNLLADHGYHVLDLDYRGSAGYGRDWRTGIYRHMGGKDLTDQVDGARWLIQEHAVDPARIGIYGGSYGGFITLMAMFTEPEVFAAGAALRPVTDWAHYNNFYTARILNLPQDDAEAYERSSPIYFAEGLEGALLICHGMVDTNVHFQDTVRLAQRLIELRKENWEVAIYPVEGHGFQNATSWADEYKRIYKLFEENLKTSVPAAAGD